MGLSVGAMGPQRWVIWIAIFHILTKVWAEKDGSYYPYPNFVNPNIYYDMYWKDAKNVIDDIDQFSHLYVSHHGCVWSGSTVQIENENGDEEGDYWYMGGPQRFQANTAYSLYGVLKGQRDVGCSAKTYINSFFTNAGLETFAAPMSVDVSDVDSTCGNGNNDKDRKLLKSQRRRRQEENGDDYGYDAYSYGTGCNAKQKYVTDSFGGEHCDAAYWVETTDSLDDFNTAMDEIQCFNVYEAQEEDEDGQDDDGDDAYYNSIAYSLLTYSDACDNLLYYDKCPDPFGMLAKYHSNLNKAVALAERGLQWKMVEPFPFEYYASIVTAAGVTLFVIVAAVVLFNRQIFFPPPSTPKTVTSNISMDDQSYFGDAIELVDKKRSTLSIDTQGILKSDSRNKEETPTLQNPEPLASREPSIASRISQKVQDSLVNLAENVDAAIQRDDNDTVNNPVNTQGNYKSPTHDDASRTVEETSSRTDEETSANHSIPVLPTSESKPPKAFFGRFKKTT